MKYMIIKHRNMANTLQMVTGQRPYIYTDKEDDSKTVWSFVNDEAFQEAYTVISELIEKNRK